MTNFCCWKSSGFDEVPNLILWRLIRGCILLVLLEVLRLFAICEYSPSGWIMPCTPVWETFQIKMGCMGWLVKGRDMKKFGKVSFGTGWCGEYLWAPVLKVIEEKDQDREKHGDGDRQNHHQTRVDHLCKSSFLWLSDADSDGQNRHKSSVNHVCKV